MHRWVHCSRSTCRRRPSRCRCQPPRRPAHGCRAGPRVTNCRWGGRPDVVRVSFNRNPEAGRWCSAESCPARAGTGLPLGCRSGGRGLRHVLLRRSPRAPALPLQCAPRSPGHGGGRDTGVVCREGEMSSAGTAAATARDSCRAAPDHLRDAPTRIDRAGLSHSIHIVNPQQAIPPALGLGPLCPRSRCAPLRSSSLPWWRAVSGPHPQARRPPPQLKPGSLNPRPPGCLLAA